MNRWIALFVLVASPFFAQGTAHALRCGTRLVTTGDSDVYVRSVCGEPASVQTRIESRTRSVVSRPLPGGGFIGDSITVSITVEIWVYDFGPRRFMEQLVFEEGILVRSRPLSYGTRRTAVDRAITPRDVAPRPALLPRRDDEPA